MSGSVGPAARLPDFPWDRLEPAKQAAGAHPDGIVDLSVGTPVDPTPPVVQDALRAASDAPGYPLTAGTAAFREAAAGWLARRHGVTDLDPSAVLPTIGSKELVALLPGQLGIGAGEKVLLPEVAYPTYAVGALLAGAEPVALEPGPGVDPTGVRLLWLNSPANPSGRVLDTGQLRTAVDWARGHGIVVASDECYLEFGFEQQPVSVLHPDVCGGSHEGLLAVHSLSKRSNLAGYRAGFVAGDPRLVADLLAVRKHSGLIVPAPVEAAAVAACGDDEHVQVQVQRYADRRARLRLALAAQGLTVEHSTAGLYLWATADENCWRTTARLADLGILVAPGDFYGQAGARHVRIALTATDERIVAACHRLTTDPSV